ncbi:hypothetical protein B1R32_1328 [Abditibacterium utsteinense]|uniref:Uncharacterized protein n=1 Tax=Abditibacterium utsteinense TaxID=1960156 RepID=A0A2S8SNW7_9BACT|nr:hypothetical protein B1R32_1328 [Abditibacterium utsteinense]
MRIVHGYSFIGADKTGLCLCSQVFSTPLYREGIGPSCFLSIWPN